VSEETGGHLPSDQARGDEKTVPASSRPPTPFERVLSQFAESIERLSAESGSEMDSYSRGFVAGLRAAIQVAANRITSESAGGTVQPEKGSN